MCVSARSIRGRILELAIIAALLALSSDGVVGQEELTAPALHDGPREITFPNEQPLGIIKVYALDDMAFEECLSPDFQWRNSDWRIIGPAVGTVTIPDNVLVRLDISELGARDLNGLTQIPPDVFHSIVSRAASLGDEQFERINAQRGLLNLQVYDSQCTDRSAEHLRPLANLVDIRWSNYSNRSRGYGFTDASAEAWTSLTQLHSLFLQEHDVGDETCRSLSQLDRLRSLSLIDTKATDKGMREIAKLPALESLVLGSIEKGTPITDAGLESICQISTLKEVVLSASKITGAGLPHLAKLRNLETLKMDHVDITNDDLAHLEPLQTLTWLRYSGNRSGRIDDIGAEHLSQLQNLTTITGSWNLTSEGYRHLAKLSKLESLNIHSDIDAAALEAISSMAGLRSLSLQWGGIDDEAIKTISKLHNLRSLLLNNVPITARALEHIGTMTSLQRLTLDNQGACPGLEDGIHHLGSLTNLRDLGLYSINVDRRHWPTFRHFKRLERLSVENTHEPIGPELLDQLAGCQQLQSIYLDSTVFDDAALLQLRQFPNLTGVNLSCLASDIGILQLANLPKIGTIRLFAPNASAKLEEDLRRASSSLRQVKIVHFESPYSFHAEGLLQTGTPAQRIDFDAMQSHPAPRLSLSPIQHLPPTFSLDSRQDKVVIVAFLRHNPERSETEITRLKELYLELKDRDFELIAIYVDGDRKEIAKSLEEREITWPSGQDVEGVSEAAWHVPDTPTYFVIDQAGNIKYAGLHRSELSRAATELLDN